MSDAYNFGGNTPGMGTADPNLWARLWGYVHPQAPPAAGPQTGPAGPTTPGGGIVSAVSPPPAIPIGGGPGNVMQAPTGTPAPAAAIPPSATASVPQAAPPGRSPFVQLDRAQNADVAGGPLSRGGSPQMTALDLSHLFGGGQPAAAPAPARVNIPPAAAAAAPPVDSSPGIHDVPPGRQSMTPDQLARAIKKPNWWQNM